MEFIKINNIIITELNNETIFEIELSYNLVSVFNKTAHIQFSYDIFNNLNIFNSFKPILDKIYDKHGHLVCYVDNYNDIHKYDNEMIKKLKEIIKRDRENYKTQLKSINNNIIGCDDALSTLSFREKKLNRILGNIE